jgi:hypothetical protein
MKLGSWHPSSRDRELSAWLILGTGSLSCLAVLLLSIPFLSLPRGSEIRLMQYAATVFGIAAISFALAVCLIGVAWTSSRRGLGLAGLLVSLMPLPLCALIFRALSYFFGITLAD